MPRPPRQIFQRLAKSMNEIKETIKKNTIKYFLVFFIFMELLSFLFEIASPELYYNYLFNIFVQVEFLVLFLFLLRFNFCKRNKIIIYFLLFYFSSNIILPFVISNEVYTQVSQTLGIFLLCLLFSYTIFNSNNPKK